MVNIRQEKSDIDGTATGRFKRIDRNLGVLRFVSFADYRFPNGSAGFKENQRIMKVHSWIVGAIATIALLAAPPVKAQSSLAAAEATAFLGTWTITLESPQGPFEQVLELKDTGGKVSGQITSAIAPEPASVTDISKDGEDLVLKFNGDFQGTAFTAKITMSLQGSDKAKATFDVMDGQFVMDGTAVKK
jgi:hypothetical protein